MKIFEMDCYEVTETDGGGMHSNHVAFVSNMDLANELVDRQAGWRNVHQYKKTLVVFDTMEEIESHSKAALRKSALAKLSALEKQALGLE